MDSRPDRFAKIPVFWAPLLEEHRLWLVALSLMVNSEGGSGHCRKGVRRLAQDVGISKSKTARDLAKLVELGLVVAVQGAGKRAEYYAQLSQTGGNAWDSNCPKTPHSVGQSVPPVSTTVGHVKTGSRHIKTENDENDEAALKRKRDELRPEWAARKAAMEARLIAAARAARKDQPCQIMSLSTSA